MAAQKGKKSLNVDIDAAAFDAFAEWIADKKLVKMHATEAAIMLIQEAPLFLRELALTGKWDKVREWLGQADYLVTADRLDRQVPKDQKGHRKRRSAAS